MSSESDDNIERLEAFIEKWTEEPRKEKMKIDLPFEVKAIKQGQCLSQMLADGEIDVLFCA